MISEYQSDLAAFELEMELWDSKDQTVWTVSSAGGVVGEEGGSTMMEGIASRLEHTVNNLRREIVVEKKRLDQWQSTLLEAQNALDAVVYDDGLDVVKTGRWRSKAKSRFRNLMDVMATFPGGDGGGGGGSRDLTYRDVELFSSDGLLDIVDGAFEEFMGVRRNLENLALLESLMKGRKSSGGGLDDGSSEEEERDEMVKKEEQRDVSAIGLTLSDLVAAQEKIELESRLIMTKLTNDTEVMKRMDEWVKKTVEEMKDQIVPYIPPDEDDYIISDPTEMKQDGNDQIPNRLLPDQILSIIDTRLEIEHADRTDQIDYASVRSGSKVIRSGLRSTSPSVSSSMPLLNRILSQVNLRFYGHHAEAALNPTYPINAVGQCWSVEPEGTRKNLWETSELVTSTIEKTTWDFTTLDVDFPWDDGEREIEDRKTDSYRGAYATLAVRLAKPVRVVEVVIEHPPVEVMKERGPAVKEFRVIGFENGKASGRSPWLLGSFVYDIGSNVSMQKFSVTTIDENGRRLPPLSSIVLAIDSNWDADFTCLYRFRVHGN